MRKLRAHIKHLAPVLAFGAVAGCGALLDVGGEVLRDQDASAAPDVSAEAEAPDVADASDDSIGWGQCATFAFDTKGTTLSAISARGIQDIAIGGTLDATTILVARGASPCSSNATLVVVDETPPGSGVYKAHGVPPLTGTDTGYEQNATMAADGRTIIALSADRQHFLTSVRSSPGLVDFTTPSAGDFGQIAAKGGQTLWAPVLSADGLAFYYVVQGDPSPAINGVYESLRGSGAGTPFPPGSRMADTVQSVAQYVTGISEDRLTLFVAWNTNFATVMLGRASLSDPFTNPLWPRPPPLAPGLRARPLAGCRRVIGGVSPGGCINEDIAVWAHL